MLQQSSTNCLEVPNMSSAMKEVTVQLPKKHNRPDEPWHHYLTIDVIWYVLGYTLFHPFVSWVVVLCLRAQYTPYGNPEMRIAIAWSILMSAIGIFSIISDRIAFGSPREVDLAEEVIVITGGAEGLGGLLAETYGMRNANIAVLDIKKMDQDEAEEKGITYYQCDVSDVEQVEAAAAKIVKDVSCPRADRHERSSNPFSSVLQQSSSTTPAWSTRNPFWTPQLQRSNSEYNQAPRVCQADYKQDIPRQHTLAFYYPSHVSSSHASRTPWYHRDCLVSSRPPWSREPLCLYCLQGCPTRPPPFPPCRARTDTRGCRNKDDPCHPRPDEHQNVCRC
jgi:hypothetical protein